MKYLITVLCSAAVYLFVAIGLRILGKKELSQINTTDLVFIMLLGNAVQNAMLGEENDFWSGILAALTLMVMNQLFKNMLYRSERFGKLMEGEPVVLIRSGKVNEKRLRESKINSQDLEQICRENGYLHPEQVALAILEVDGKVSFIDDQKLD